MSRIHSILAFDPTIDANTFARSCRDWGIDTPCLHPGFLEEEEMVRALDVQGLRLWLNVPVFCDPKYLQSHPDHYAITSRGRRAAQDWLHFVCPSRDEFLDGALAALLRDLAMSAPAVVSLDFIRHFVFWERVPLDGSAAEIEDGCYCPLCLSRFEEACGERIDRRDPSAFIHRHLLSPWANWKCRRISEVAERLLGVVRARSPEVTLAIQTIPWRESDLDGSIRTRAGQDLLALSRSVDMLAPMAFPQMLGRTTSWKEQLLADVSASTAKPVCSYVQAEALYRSGTISATQFEDELERACAGDHPAIIVFQYEQLAAQPEKAAILTRHFR